jgi:hypothetical protein
VGVRAVWHTELVLDEAGDPFAEPEPKRIEDAGTPIALNADGERAQLQRALITSVTREGALDAQGVRCAIKNVGDASCHACPLYLEDGSLAAQLCAVGREQERLCTRIAVLQHGGRRE